MRDNNIQGEGMEAMHNLREATRDIQLETVRLWWNANRQDLPTLKRICELAGLNQNTMANALNGYNTPSMTTLTAFTNHLRDRYNYPNPVA